MTKSASDPPSQTSRLRADKRRAILDAAARIFMRDGFGLAGIDQIVAESGVSKRTLYAHFPGKEALFGAIIEEWCQELLMPLREADIMRRDPRDALIELGRLFLKVMLSREGLSLYRVVIAEAARFPDLGRIFYESGHRTGARLLAGYISEKVSDGVFRELDSRMAAEAYFLLVRGYVHERLLLGVASPPDEQDMEKRLAFAADLFLDGVKPRHTDV